MVASVASDTAIGCEDSVQCCGCAGGSGHGWRCDRVCGGGGGGGFAGLRDPRVQASCERLLFDIVSISILAMACGADDWTDLETFGNKR